jgi:uncharacterized OB-fold protein
VSGGQQHQPSHRSDLMTKCVSCGADVARNAKACPKCGEVKPAQPYWVFPAALAALLALAAIYAIMHPAH